MPGKGYRSLTLDDQTMEELDKIRQELGITSQSDVVRMLVKRKHLLFPALFGQEKPLNSAALPDKGANPTILIHATNGSFEGFDVMEEEAVFFNAENYHDDFVISPVSYR